MRYVTCEPHAAMDLLATHFESEAILNTGSRLILQATTGRGVVNPFTDEELIRAHWMNAKAAENAKRPVSGKSDA